MSNPVKELGKRLAALLDEDAWVYIEPFLIEVEMHEQNLVNQISQYEAKFVQTHNWLCDRNEATEIERLQQSESVMKAYYEQVFADGGKRIADLKQQLSAAQNSDQHNFDRWQVEQADNEQLLNALEFYAEGYHFIQHDPNKWDSVSGEPQNFLEDESNTATVEDGSVAKHAIVTHKARKEQS